MQKLSAKKIITATILFAYRENQLLLTLMYYLEYRTQFHIAHTYGISESAVCHTTERIENILSKIKELQLPGKKVLAVQKQEFSVIVIDAIATPVEQPKKTAALLKRQEIVAYTKAITDDDMEEQTHYLHGTRQR